MAGPDFLSRPVNDGRNDGRIALPAGARPSDRPGGIQRLSVKATAAACRSPGTSPVWARIARRRGPVADRGGNASGCTAAPVYNPGGYRSRGTGADSGASARGGSEAAGTDAAD